MKDLLPDVLHILHSFSIISGCMLGPFQAFHFCKPFCSWSDSASWCLCYSRNASKLYMWLMHCNFPWSASTYQEFAVQAGSSSEPKWRLTLPSNQSIISIAASRLVCKLNLTCSASVLVIQVSTYLCFTASVFFGTCVLAEQSCVYSSATRSVFSTKSPEPRMLDHFMPILLPLFDWTHRGLKIWYSARDLEAKNNLSLCKFYCNVQGGMLPMTGGFTLAANNASTSLLSWGAAAADVERALAQIGIHGIVTGVDKGNGSLDYTITLAKYAHIKNQSNWQFIQNQSKWQFWWSLNMMDFTRKKFRLRRPFLEESRGTFAGPCSFEVTMRSGERQHIAFAHSHCRLSKLILMIDQAFQGHHHWSASASQINHSIQICFWHTSQCQCFWPLSWCGRRHCISHGHTRSFRADILS